MNYIFGFMVVTLIFNNTPELVKMNFFGDKVGSKLVFYPLVIGLVYTICYYYKRKEVPPYFKKFLQFIGLYVGIVLISLLVGLSTYPYYDVVFAAPLSQIDKLPKVLVFFADHGVYLDEKQALGLWMIARTIKAAFLEALWCFGGAYMVYCWYHDDWRKAIKIVTKGVLAGLVVIFAYSSIELYYLSGFKAAENILVQINPYIHSIKENGTWYPPMLWKNQLRSVFAEPSYFGIYTAFSMPLLWLKITETQGNKKYIFMLITVVMGFLLFLTKARTGFILHLMELCLLVLATLIIRRKEFVKATGMVLLCSFIAFVGSNFFIGQFMSNNSSRIASIMSKNSSKFASSVTEYVESNAASLANLDKRSNRARYSVMEADFKIGLDNPVFGVGRGLRNAYMPDYFSGKAKANTEVKMWMNHQKLKGILKSGYPYLGEYTSRFAETGVLGLFVFIFPLILLVRTCIIKIIKENYRSDYIFFFIALISMGVAGIGDNVNVTYCYWLLLGLGYVMCYGKENKVNNAN